MKTDYVKSYLSPYKWVIAIFVLIVMGYSLGKEMALRENRLDAANVASSKVGEEK